MGAAAVAGGRPLGRGGGGASLHHAADPGGGARLKAAALADADLDEDRLAATDDAVKGERKKQVARTRSGRLSRPPRHMVKDYKRLHHLDFADADLDDSDGGYSDYQMSDREGDELDSTGIATGATSGGQGSITTSLTDGNSDTTGSVLDVAGKVPPAAAKGPDGATPLLPGLQTSKRKISSHFRCPTCQKVYLGHSRMARHFDMFPDHGAIDQMRNSSSADPASPLPLPDSTQGKVGLGLLNGIVRHSGGGRRRGKRRGPWAYMTPEARSERRKIKLREALGPCEAKELSEVAGPAVAGVMSLWELLLLRVESVRTEESLVATLCEELRALLEKVQAVASEVLQPIDTISKKASSDKVKFEHLELQDDLLCHALGLPSGVYHVVDDHLLRRLSPATGLNLNLNLNLKLDAEERQRGVKEEEQAEELCRDRVVSPPAKRLKAAAADEDVKKEEGRAKPSCPEVLSALALESKPSMLLQATADGASDCGGGGVFGEEPSSGKPGGTTPTHVQSDFSVVAAATVPEDEDHPFLLPPTSEMCVEDLPHEAGGDHHETVDDIVNERLKNLTGFGTGVHLHSHSPPPPPHHHHDPASAERRRQQAVAAVTFDPEMALAAMGEGGSPGEDTAAEYAPEIALAAMGEGEREPPASTLEGLRDSAVSGVERTLMAMGEGRQESDDRNGSLFPSATSGSVFDPLKTMDVDDALAAMGEGKPCSQSRPRFSSSVEAVFGMKSIQDEVDDVEGVDRALAAMGEGEQEPLKEQNGSHFSSTTTRPVFDDVKSVEEDTSVDVGHALAAMGEGHQRSPEQNAARFSSPVEQVFESIEEHVSLVSGTSEVTPPAESKQESQPSSSLSSSREDFSDLGLSSLETSQVDTSIEGKEELVAFTSSMLTSSGNTFITSLAEGSTSESSMNKSAPGSDPTVSNFDPEIALAAMGEGEPCNEDSQMHLNHHHHHTASTFDPEIELASMGEGVTPVPGTQEFQTTPDPSGTDPTFHLTSMDVSLDESGADLDFDALSVEFSRTARQS